MLGEMSLVRYLTYHWLGDWQNGYVLWALDHFSSGSLSQLVTGRHGPL